MKSAVLFMSLLLSGVVLAAPAAGGRLVPAEEVCSVARELLGKEAAKQGLTAEIECPHARPIDAPMGSLEWTFAGSGWAWIAGPSRIVLSLTANGKLHQEVVVPVLLSIGSKAWVSRRAVSAGARIDPNDVGLRDVKWPVGVVPSVAGNTPPTGRTKFAIKAGEVVPTTVLVPSDARLQGDTVMVAVRTGGVTLEMPAVLAGNAQVGHVARVQLKGRRETLEGVLVDASTVVVER